MKRAITSYALANLAAFGLLYISGQTKNDVLQIILYASAFLLPTLGVLYVCRAGEGEPVLSQPLRLDRASAFLTLCLLPCALTALLGVGALGTWLFSSDAAAHTAEVSLTLPAALRYALLCPLVEECFFRLVPLRLFGKPHMRVACLVSTMSFIVFHASPARLLYALLAAVLFCLLDAITESLWPSVLLHGANNALVLLLNALPQNGIARVAPWALLGVLTLVGAVPLLLHRKALAKRIKSKLNLT